MMDLLHESKKKKKTGLPLQIMKVVELERERNRQRKKENDEDKEEEEEDKSKDKDKENHRMNAFFITAWLQAKKIFKISQQQSQIPCAIFQVSNHQLGTL